MLASIKFVEEEKDDGSNVMEVIDQRQLPLVETHIVLRNVQEVCEAISNMTVRGAPLLGIVAAQGMAFASKQGLAPTEAKLMLDSTRPTAVNLAKMTLRMLKVYGKPSDAFAEVKLIAEEEMLACERMAELGASLFYKTKVDDDDKAPIRVITHCNTGSLCTYGLGTALGCVIKKHAQTGNVFCYVDETRPRQQGLKLTAWELAKQGVPYTVIADSVAGSLLRQQRADLVIFGADRICANGDVVNKVGTYPLSVCARENNVPVYCVAPMSTVDFALVNGDLVEIEERDGSEVLGEDSATVAGATAYNPAFDVTPNKYITAIITERGICYPPFSRSLAALRSNDVQAPIVAAAAVVLDNKTVAPQQQFAKRTGLFLGDHQDVASASSTSFRSKYAQTKTDIGGDVSPSSAQQGATSSVRQFASVKKSSIFLTDEALEPQVVKSSVRINAPPQQQQQHVAKAHFPEATITAEQHSKAKGHHQSFPHNNDSQIFG